MMTETAMTACLLALLALPLAGAPVEPGEEDLVTKTFEIRYRDFQDAVLIVTEIVEREGSPRNSIQLQYLLKRITVTDLQEVVDNVAAAVEAFDVPPRQVRIRMILFLGTRAEGPEEEESVFNDVVAKLRAATRYTHYETLGNMDVPVLEGAGTTVTVGGGYNIEFVVSGVDAQRRIIELSPLILSRGLAAGDGNGSERILRTTLNLTADQQMVMGASSDPSSDRALLLAITGRILD